MALLHSYCMSYYTAAEITSITACWYYSTTTTTANYDNTTNTTTTNTTPTTTTTTTTTTNSTVYCAFGCIISCKKENIALTIFIILPL